MTEPLKVGPLSNAASYVMLRARERTAAILAEARAAAEEIQREAVNTVLADHNTEWPKGHAVRLNTEGQSLFLVFEPPPTK